MRWPASCRKVVVAVAVFVLATGMTVAAGEPDEARSAHPETLRPDWGPTDVPARSAQAAAMVHRFVARMSYSSGRYEEAEQELVEQLGSGGETALRNLLRDVPSTDRFRFMVAFAMYWLGFDLDSSRTVMLEYCPPGNKPGYHEDTIAFLDYAYRRRPDYRLLEGILGWLPTADGAGAAILAGVLAETARSAPRDLLAALADQPPLLWGRPGGLLCDPEARSPEGAYPALAAIAYGDDDPMRGPARRLLCKVASAWPEPVAPSGDIALLTPPMEVGGEWYVPVRQFCQWLRAGLTLSGDMSSLTVTWRGKAHTWTRASGRLVFHAGTGFIPIEDIGQAFGERVSLRANERVIDFGTSGEGCVYAAIPVGWQHPVPPEDLSPDEMQIWRRLLRPEERSGLLCEPYRIKVVGRWAAAMVHPLNAVTDDAEVLLDRRRGAWRIISMGTVPAAKSLGIPADVRQKLGVWEGP